MAIGERFRSGGTRGIARFLADHQHCDAGFDVRREDEPGSGKLKITCEGCGESVSYRAAEAVDLAAGGLGEAPTGNGSAAEAAVPASESAPETRVQPPQPTPPGPIPRLGAADTSPPPRPPPASRVRRPGPSVPSWLPVALVALLIVGGLTMIVAGLLRSDDDSGTSASATPEPTQAAEETQPQATEEAPSGDEGVSDAEIASVRLDRARVANAFVIGIPAGWERGEEDGGISITAGGSTAEIRIFFEQGERPHGELARAAAGFLADEHRGADVDKPENERFGGERAARVHADYGGGEEDAFVLSEGGFAFLVLRRMDNGASEQLEREAAAIMDSFEPA